jgi:hypothetical protein
MCRSIYVVGGRRHRWMQQIFFVFDGVVWPAISWPTDRKCERDGELVKRVNADFPPTVINNAEYIYIHFN